MKTILSIFLLFTFLANSCGSDLEPEPKIETFEVPAKYEISFIYEYYKEPGQEPIQASINSMWNTNFIDFKADGTCLFQNTDLSIRGISIWGDQDYAGTYKITGNELELNFDIDGKSYKYYASLDPNFNSTGIFSDNGFGITADKEQRLRAIEANKNSLSIDDYNKQIAYYNSSTRYEQDVVFEKK